METQNPIAEYRKRQNLTLEAFGDMVGVQKAAVSKWEDGHGPSIENAVKIEQVTGGDLPRHVTRPYVWGQTEAAQ
jgi:predicted transcriptional regulator